MPDIQVTMSPLLPAEGPRGPRLVRRVRGIAVETALLAVVTLTFPVLMLCALVVDVALKVVRRKPFVAVRLVPMLWWFLFGEMRGTLGVLAIWLVTGGPLGRRSRRRRVLIYKLRLMWSGGHMAGVKRLFGLRYEIDGLEHAGPGGAIVLTRHSSIIDNTLPDAIIGRAHGLGLRFVIKRELEMLPAIDIGGRWVPTNFVRRASGDTAGEVAKLRLLARDLGPGESVLIYPEGTRCTPAKLARAQEIIAERQPHLVPYASRLVNVLPPRLGGPMALLDEAADADVVLFGHVGLDGFERVSDVWAGGLVGTTVRMKFWRFPAAEVPREHDARVVWLYEKWQLLDDWVGEQLARAE